MSSSWSQTMSQISRISDSNSSLSQTPRLSSSDSRFKNRFDSPRPGLGRGRGSAARYRNSNPPEITDKFSQVKVSEKSSTNLDFESSEDIPVNSGGENVRSHSLGSRFNNRFNSPRPGLDRGRDNVTRYHNSNAPETTEKLNELKVSEKSSTSLDFDSEDIPVKSSGENVPSPVNTFADIDLGRALNENIKRVGFVNPTPIQRHAIPVVIAGRDLMACAQTGSGKTAAFCFPIISGISKSREGMLEEFGCRVASPVALILSPTRELTCQIHDEAKKFAHQTGVKIVVAYGGAPISQQLRNMERGVDILVATPGRLVDMMERERVSLSKLKYLTLDEADRMLDMGFEPQIRNIVQGFDMPKTGARQTMLFSATFPNEIQRLASDFLSNYIFLSVGRVGSSTDRIAQRVEYVEDMDKRNVLIDILRSQKEDGTHGKHALMLVFVETKKKADILEHWLFRNGFPATAIHGDKVQYERERALRSFRSGETPILVATDVAARGLDISHVSHVINFDLPKSIDDYVHRIGRTGRAGKSGYATAFFNQNNAPLAKSLVELMQEAKQDVPDWLNQYISNSSSYHDGNGKSSRYTGGGKFGSQDYRSNFSSAPRRYEPDGNFGGHDYRGNDSSTSHQYESNGNFGGHGYRGNDSSTPDGYENGGDYGTGSGEYAVNVGSIEPTGWD